MDRLWTPWRYQYVTKTSPVPVSGTSCIFCAKAEASDGDADLVVHRGAHNFVLLNLFPYSCGHLMIAPFEHVDSLAGAAQETAVEMMDMARRAETVLRQVYRCPGINLGIIKRTKFFSIRTNDCEISSFIQIKNTRERSTFR